MTKYRRRVPEAREVEAIFGTQRDLGRLVEKAAFVTPEGRLEVWYAEDFRRMYEPIDEKAFRAADSEYCSSAADLKRSGLIDIHAGSPAPVEKSAPLFCTYYTCTRCGKTINKGDRLIVTAAVPQRPRVAICMSCWADGAARCDSCGEKIELGNALRHGGDCAWYCRDCYAVRMMPESKPKLFTFADLKPGDVFRFKSYSDDRRCQLLAFVDEKGFRRSYRSAVIYYTNGGDGKPCISSVEATCSVGLGGLETLGHYELTRKQKLWIDATPAERTALEDSIRDKWLPRTKGAQQSTGSCALCSESMGWGDGLRSCIVKCLLGRAGEACNGGSPYRHWLFVTYKTNTPNWTPYSQQTYTLTRAMLLSLSDFLPNIHPLRLECEATSTEWPGAEK